MKYDLFVDTEKLTQTTGFSRPSSAKTIVHGHFEDKLVISGLVAAVAVKLLLFAACSL